MANRDFILRWAKKYRAIQERGGKCIKCGSNDIFTLDFHHRNPKDKQYGISDLKRHVPWDIIEKEIEKCDLLCRNCHTHIHLSKTINKFWELEKEIVEKSKVVHKISRPPLNKKRIYRLLKKKKTIMGIAKIFQKDPSTILTIAKKLEKEHGEKLFMRRDEYNELRRKVNIKKLIKLYNNGKSLKELCEYFNAAYSTITGRLRKLRRKGIALNIKKHQKKIAIRRNYGDFS